MVDHQPYDQVCPGQISTPDHCNSVLKHPHLEPHPLSFHHASLETAPAKTGKHQQVL